MHTHSFEGHDYGHDHDGGDEPHGHSHTAAEADEHTDAVEDDGTCPVCGSVHELSPDEGPEAEGEKDEPDKGDEPVSDDEPDEGGDDKPDDDDEEDDEAKEQGKATPVTVPPQADSPSEHRGQTITTNSFHAHRAHR